MLPAGIVPIAAVSVCVGVVTWAVGRATLDEASGRGVTIVIGGLLGLAALASVVGAYRLLRIPARLTERVVPVEAGVA